jgi:hypothetical protein
MRSFTTSLMLSGAFGAPRHVHDLYEVTDAEPLRP